ncbi:MAG: SDR family NAD(P)-dependent oxidoreductase, partial [Acidobacteria bacterium]|nr:SDR family NAD(P)-dependent oxidoreductase [Acidobacteriota bacterium]
IVNVTSVMGHVTLGCHGFYAATKFALAAVSESLAIEARPLGIRVAIVEPGVILTPIWGKAESFMPPDHPYQLAQARLWRHFAAQLDGGTPAELVAQAIFGAVQDGASQLRYPVGLDAEATIRAHDRLTPAEWLDLLAEPDEDRFLSRAAEAFGADLYNPPSLYQRRTAAE